MKKFDRESNTRIWEGWQKWVVYGLMAAFSLFSIYVTLFATWLDLVRYPSFVACIMLIGYLNFPAKKGVQKVNHIPWFDWIIMILGTCAFLYIVVNAKDLTVRAVGYKYLYWYEIALGIIAILALFELCRRSVGIPIMVVAGCFILYAIYYFWIGKGLSFGNAVSQLTYRLTYTTTGVMTTPIQVCAKFIVVFLIFGAFLERTGISDFFISLANCLAGSSSGGPAKVAVISSALCGMVSGSSVGNTVTTGSVTIPMMKKTGYKPEFAGAVEAAASTGGQIMPPIMGAAAFLMAEYVGVSYSSIIVRAILPAVLYFLGIFICVHLEAKRLGLKGIPREQLPKFRMLAKKLYLLLPLVILIYLVCSGNRTMAYAATISIMACIVVSLFNKDARMTPTVLFDALAKGGQSCISVAAACAIAGVIAGCITMTGLASQIITAVITIANGHLIVALLLTMICCIILGMGVPTTANYCIMASTCAPILIQMGVPTLAAHFFVFYFGIVADITPPVALAAYAGSAIAGSKPMRTAVNATKLAIAAFVVPYIFAFNPAMLLIDTNALEVIQLIITSIVGMVSLGVALEGYLRGPVPWPLRIVAAAGGLFLIYPGTLSDVVGLVVIVAIFAFQFLRNKKQETPAAA
ncbi:MAG: TRAP transporter permease [Oscillospiraceae bacterium]|nr:TRAP transporter permease [Oscillospiraceae bacterium]